MFRFTLVVVFAVGLFAADPLVTPIDPAQMQEATAALQTAVQGGDAAAVITGGRRVLELYPNEPMIQASVYRLMAEAAQKSGDSKQAAQYAAVSKNLDPALDTRMSAAQSATVTRGKMDNLAAALSMVTQGVQVYQNVRGQMQAQKAAQMQMQPQPQFQQPAQMQQQPQQQFMPQQGANVNYPQAPIGTANYQPMQVAPAPPPGWAPQQQFQQPQYPQQQYPQQQYPQQQPQQFPQQQQYAPPAAQGGGPYSPPVAQQQPQYAQQQQPQYAQQPAFPQAPQQAPQGGGGPYSPPMDQQAMQQYPYPAAQAPYGGNGYAPPAGALRGDKPAIYKVIHDHSRVGDASYFQESCGALLSVSGSNLTFTPSGGESAIVIPASDIIEIRMNTQIGRNSGAFHISTKRGLYLSLVLQSQDRDEARTAVDSLRAKLGIE